MDYYQNGRFAEAENLAISITEEFPLHQFAWKILAVVFKQTGRITESIAFMREAVKLNPKDAEAHNNMGVILQELGRLKEAEASYNQAIILENNYFEAHNNLGNIFKDQGTFDKALISYDEAILINPNYAAAHYNMAITLKLLGKSEEAIVSYTKAIELNPNHADAYNNLGNAFKDIGNTHEAIESYKKTLLLNPNYAFAYNNIGNILKDEGKLEEAIDSFKKALLINPNYVDAYNNIGNAFKEQGKFQKAIDAFKKALFLKPDNSVAHKNLSFALLNMGRFKEGLLEYEWRLKTKDFVSQLRHFSQPMWDGQKSLNGKRILIWCEQGVGDTINWSSCLSFIVSQSEHCILECQSKLVPLLERSFQNVKVIPENRSLDSERDDFDYHLPMGSLYKNFIKEICTTDFYNPYLIPNPVRVDYWRKQLKSLGNGPYIGISWKSTNISAERLSDYTSISEWFPLLNIPDVTFINLQYKDYEDDLVKIKDELGVIVHNFDNIDHYDDIDDVTSLCSALDMVVSTKLTVPFISAGVGTLTKLAIWRQSSSNNILLNPISSQVDIYEKNTWEPWEKVFHSISQDILKLRKNTHLF